MSDVNEIVVVPFDENADYGPLIMCVEDHMRPPTQGVMLSQLVRGKHKYAYEVMGVSGRRLYPFFDWETYRDSPESLARDKWTEWEACIQKLKAQFGENVKIVGLDACGKKGDRYIISFHAFVHGVGSYRCGKDMLRAGIVPQGFDTSVYKEEDSRQLFRMVGMSKAGEDRPFRYIMKHEEEWKSADIWKMDEQTRRLVMLSTLAQCSEGEQPIEVAMAECPEVEIKQTESGEVVALGANGLALGDDVKATVDNIRPLCVMAGWFQEFERSYERWRDEMWMLENIAHDAQLGDGLDALMIEVSAVCKEKHTEQSVVAIKAVSSNRPANKPRKHLGHLRKEAKSKDPLAYAAWLKPVQKVQELEQAGGDKRMASIIKLLRTELADADVAEQLIAGGWVDDYLWLPEQGKHGTLMKWNGTIWEANKPDILNPLISQAMHGELEAMVKAKWTPENNLPCAKKMKRLRSLGNINSIIAQVCALKGSAAKIEWNCHPFKLAFENGVLDLKTWKFEAGERKDYITQSTGYPLPLVVGGSVESLFISEAKRFAEIDELYKRIIPDTETLAVLWQILGACLVGEVLENVFIFTGEGRNGKSLTTKFLKCVIGKEFFYRGDDATIQRDASSGTNQAIVNMSYKRCTLFSEPYEGCKLRTSVLKDLTGGDETHARGLYSSETSVQLSHKVIIECNGGVNYDKVDQAIDKRTVVVPFVSLFTTQQELDLLPPDAQNVFLAHDKYKQKEWQREHRVAMLCRMLIGLREMMRVSQGKFMLTKIPEAMRRVKAEFMEDSDEIGTWFSSSYKLDSDPHAHIKVCDAYKRFTESSTFANFSKHEKRNKGTLKIFKQKLISNPKVKPFYRERWQPRLGGGECLDLRNIIMGYTVRFEYEQ